ncbi:MAG: LacI family DNA-binding transcriptional regulator [Jatrophihabitans sp.]
MIRTDRDREEPMVAVTLRDVADRAGVSVRTVSNVVNGFQHVSSDMRERVQAALHELDYRPNLLARSLRQGRTGLVALLIPEISEPYFAEVAHAIIEHARALSLTVLIDESGGDADRELELLDIACRSRLVDGVLLSALGLGSDRLTDLHLDIPVVQLGEQAAKRFDHVTIDNVAASRAAVEHLIGSGRKRIAAIGRESAPAPATARLRMAGYQAALADAGLPEDPDLAPVVTQFHRADGAAAMRDLLQLKQPPDAVFAFNDRLALGAMRAVVHAGRRVPEDVMIVGFDDIEEATYSNPTLSSVRPDKQAIARAALDALQQRIAGDTSTPARIVVDHELIVRDSSSAAKPVRSKATGRRTAAAKNGRSG